MSVAAKARELLTDLVHEADRCPHCGGHLPHGEGRWIGLDSFDPPHGKSEVTYATGKGLIERDPVDPMRVRVTPRGRDHLNRKPRSDSVAGQTSEVRK